MKNVKKYLSAGVLSAVALTAASNAQTTTTVGVSLGVENTLTIEVVQPISLGSYLGNFQNGDGSAAVADDIATVLIQAEPGATNTLTDGDTAVAFKEIVPGTPGVFKITGGTPGAKLDVIVAGADGFTKVSTSNALKLTDPRNSTAAYMEVVDQNVWSIESQNGFFEQDFTAEGNLEFAVGVTFRSFAGEDITSLGADGAVVAYPDVQYTGTYKMIINYGA